MAHLRLKNNLRGDVETFLSILSSGKKFKHKVKKTSEKDGALIIEGEIHFEE